MYEITDEVPIPTKGKGGMLMLTLEALQIGQSFYVAQSRSSICARISAYAKQTGKRFTTRLEDTGLRIWRLR